MRTLQKVASQNTYGKLVWVRLRVRNASISLSRPAQIRETSDLAPIHRSAVGAALNSIVCLDCGVRGGVRVGDRPASLSGCSCGSSRRGMGEKIWLGGDGLFPVKQVVEQGVPRVFPGPVLG